MLALCWRCAYNLLEARSFLLEFCLKQVSFCLNFAWLSLRLSGAFCWIDALTCLQLLLGFCWICADHRCQTCWTFRDTLPLSHFGNSGLEQTMGEEATRYIDLFDSRMHYVESGVQAREMLDRDLRRLACAIQSLGNSERRILGRALACGMSVEGVASEFGLSMLGARSEIRRVEGRLLEALERSEVPSPGHWPDHVDRRALALECSESSSASHACKSSFQTEPKLLIEAAHESPRRTGHDLTARAVCEPCDAYEPLPQEASAFVPLPAKAAPLHGEWGRHVKGSRSRRGDRRIASCTRAPAH